jgi:hypothetical protein
VGGGGSAVIGRNFIWVLKAHYGGVAGYHPVFSSSSRSSCLTMAPQPGTRSYGQVP